VLLPLALTLSLSYGARIDVTAALLDKMRNASASSGGLQAIFQADNALAESSVESLEWLNTLLSEIWPDTNKAMNQIVVDTVNPLLASSLPGPLASLQVQPFSLTKVPTFGPIAVYKTSDGLKIRLGVHLETDETIAISSKGGVLKWTGVSAGIHHLSLKGDLIIHLAPIISQLPVIGGARIYFLNSPNIHFDLAGIANVGDIYGASALVRSAITSAIADKLVMPNCIGIPLATPEQGVDPSFFEQASAVGLVRITVKQARNLPSHDWSVWGKSKSDPYVTIETADRSWSTTAITNSLNPDWSEGNTHDFVVYDKGQTVQFSVYDEDTITANDLIGTGTPLTYSDIAGKEVTMALKDKDGMGAGTLTAWIDQWKLAPCSSSAPSGGFVLLVNVDRIMMPGSVATSASAVFTLEGESKSTAKGHLPISVTAVMQDIVERMHSAKMSISQIAELVGISQGEVEGVVKKVDADHGLFTGDLNLRIGSKLYFPNLIPKGRPMNVKIIDADGNALAEHVVELAPLDLEKTCVSKQALQLQTSNGANIMIYFDVELMKEVH
jgi:hypothetical protein